MIKGRIKLILIQELIVIMGDWYASDSNELKGKKRKLKTKER